MSKCIKKFLESNVYSSNASSIKEDNLHMENNNELLWKLNWNVDLAIKLLKQMKETIIEQKVIQDYNAINNNLEALIQEISK